VLVWGVTDPKGFPPHLPDSIRWVQLPSAGVERWLSSGIIDGRRTWTSASAAYAALVAEHAAMLLLSGVRQLPVCLSQESWAKEALWPRVRSLNGSTVAIVGCGNIGRALIPILSSLGCRVFAVNRSGRQVAGTILTLPQSRLDDVWGLADHFVLAAPATTETQHLVSRPQLDRMSAHSWLVNVARGSLIDTAALVKALDAGQICGVAIDVTDPEPLPQGHPLWKHPRAIITPHIANPLETMRAEFSRHLTVNLTNYRQGRPLAGVIDQKAGY
jgi:D-3-phosphoglycerate dehydrogenase